MKYEMDDGKVVDTFKCKYFWEEEKYFDGYNFISINTRTQWEHERLYFTKSDRYFIEKWSNWQGSIPTASWVSSQEAAKWLILNEYELPDDLKKLEEGVVE